MDTKSPPVKNNFFLLVFGYVALIFTVTAIPSYLYFQNAYDQHKRAKLAELHTHADTLKKGLHSPGVYHFPRSLLLHAGLYNTKGHLTASDDAGLFSDNLKNLAKNEAFYYYTMKLPKPKAGIQTIVTATPKNTDTITLKLLLVGTSIFLFILLSSYFVFRSAIAPYERMNRYLDAFFNDAMHELKTPLGVIGFNLELLEQKQPGQKEIKRAMNGVKGLQFIYEDIEYMIKHKHIDYAPQLLDISSFILHRLEFFDSFAKAKKIRLDAHIAKNLCIDFNKVELQRIVDNTLSNAIKYSKPKTMITVQLYQNQADRILFKVKDYGSGIKDTKSIFKRYSREDTIQGGFGIGLSIVKTICDKNGVEVTVNSAPKQGAEFIYSFTPAR